MDTHTPERAFLHLCADETWQSGQIEWKKERKKLEKGKQERMSQLEELLRGCNYIGKLQRHIKHALREQKTSIAVQQRWETSDSCLIC